MQTLDQHQRRDCANRVNDINNLLHAVADKMLETNGYFRAAAKRINRDIEDIIEKYNNNQYTDEAYQELWKRIEEFKKSVAGLEYLAFDLNILKNKSTGT